MQWLRCLGESTSVIRVEILYPANDLRDHTRVGGIPGVTWTIATNVTRSNSKVAEFTGDTVVRIRDRIESASAVV
jgi:hypothetical protein